MTDSATSALLEDDDAKRATEALSTGRKGLKAAVGKDWMRDPYVEESTPFNYINHGCGDL